MATQYGPEPIQDSHGKLLQSTNVYVFQPGSSTLATLYEAQYNTNPVTNPVITTATGNITFFADPGTYDLSLTNPPTNQITVDLISDLTVWVYSQPGTLQARDGSLRRYTEIPMTILGARASVNTSPGGGNIVVDINKNGTTIFSNQANRPSISPGSNTAVSGTPDIRTLAIGDYLTVDIDTTGISVLGSDLTVNVQVHPA